VWSVATSATGTVLALRSPCARSKPGNEEKQTAAVQVAFKDSVFRAKIRYENLRAEELGLFVVDRLPTGAKQYIWVWESRSGSAAFAQGELRHEIDRKTRYASLSQSASQLKNGRRTMALKRSTRPWIPSSCGISTARYTPNAFNVFWGEEHLVQLRCMLSFDSLPQGEAWFNRTRYLEFGRVPGMPGNYNEYLHIRDQRGNRITQKRRPLPPASQVFTGGPALPADARPDFDKTYIVPDLRRPHRIGK